MPVLSGSAPVNPTGIATSGIANLDQATREQRSGNTVDPKHAKAGETATPYPWEEFANEPHGPYGIDNQLLGMPIAAFTAPAGRLGEDPTADLQPQTRAAPWPKGTPLGTGPDDLEDRHAQTTGIRADKEMGGARKLQYDPTLEAQQDQWTELWEVDPGASIQEKIPQQISGTGSGGYGTRDRVQSEAGQNEYGFDSAHMHRRYATGPIPGNTMWMQPGGRVISKSVAGTARPPVGADTPFAGQDIGASFDSYGAVLTDPPVAYQSPPDPVTVSDYSGDGTAALGFNYGVF